MSHPADLLPPELRQWGNLGEGGEMKNAMKILKIKQYLNFKKGSILFCNFLMVSGVLFYPDTINAQTLLSKADAVKITLENNYDIKVAKNDIEIARKNTSRALNGYKPTLDASAGTNANLGGSTQKFSSGMENEVKNAFSWGANASVSANYTLIDKTRDITVDQLKEIINLSDLQLKQIIENNLLAVFVSYYDVARLTANNRVLAQTIEVSNQRLKRAKYQYDYGQGIRLNVLNAEVDIQRDSINLLNSYNQLANAKRNLNVVMGRPVNMVLEVDTLVGYDATLTLEQLIKDAKSKNVLIQLIDKNLDITNYEFDIIESSKKPTIGASAGYDFNFSDNASGSFIDLSTNRGFSAGVNLNWNIFDGGRRKVQKEITRINVESQSIQKEQVLQQLERDVTNAWESYQNALFILKAEAKNLDTNQLNFKRTEEQFKIGQVTSVEFRQAQLNLFNAATNYNTAKYDAKIIEIQLLQLSGRLLEISF